MKSWKNLTCHHIYYPSQNALFGLNIYNSLYEEVLIYSDAKYCIIIVWNGFLIFSRKCISEYVEW